MYGFDCVAICGIDHTIRTKNWPLILPAPEAGALGDFREAAQKAFKAFAKRYHDYFARNNRRQKTPKTELDPVPRVVLVPGLGLFGTAEIKK